MFAALALALLSCGGDAPDRSSAGPSAATPAAAASTAAATPDVTAAPAPVRIASTDGLATIAIPRAALPAGVSPADITISAAVREASEPGQTDGANAQPAGPEPIAVVQLGPDGLRFEEPVPVTVSVPASLVGELAVALLASGGQAEFVSVVAEPGPEPGRVTLTAAVPHFTDLILIGGVASNAIDVTVAPSSVDGVAGEQVTLTATVTRSGSSEARATLHLEFPMSGEFVKSVPYFEGFSEYLPAVEYELRVRGGEWEGTAAWSLLSGTDVVELVPRFVDHGESMERSAAPSRTKTATVTCLRSGEAQIRFSAHARIPTSGAAAPNAMAGSPPFGERTLAHSRDVLIDVSCQAPHIVAEANPPTTTYTVTPDVKGAEHYVWSGPDCGIAGGSTTPTMVWEHGEEGCEHAGEMHPTTEISLLVTGTSPDGGEPFELRCTYRSAASGNGSDCEPAGR